MNIAIIPARGGSKRIPRKNVRTFCGKPMLAWSIEAAQRSRCFDRIIVSTDDAEIAETSRRFGAEVPFKRPQALSDDHTGTNAVVTHAVDYILDTGAQLDVVACIYATAPFLQPEQICEGVNCVSRRKDVAFAVTVTRYPFPIQRALIQDSYGLCVLREPENAMKRSQDLRDFFHDAGQLYCGRPSSFRETRSVFEKPVHPILVGHDRVQDIDTPEDWERAEFLFERLSRGKND